MIRIRFILLVCHTAIISLLNAIPQKNYDCVVSMSKLEDLVNPSVGWRLEEKSHDGLTRFKTRKPTIFVSALGSFNAGKTWAINQLAKTALPSDTQVHTEGYSFLTTEENKDTQIAWLDTEGLNSFVTTANEQSTHADRLDAMQQRLKELERQEAFRKAVTTAYADVFLFVLNDLTFQDLIDLFLIRKQLKEGGDTSKSFVVLHNLKTRTKAEVDKSEYFDTIKTMFLMRDDSRKVTYEGIEIETWNTQTQHKPSMRHVFTVKNEVNQAYNQAVLRDTKLNIAFQTPEEKSTQEKFLRAIEKTIQDFTNFRITNIKVQTTDDESKILADKGREQETAVKKKTLTPPVATEQATREDEPVWVISIPLPGLQTDGEAIIENVSEDQGHHSLQEVLTDNYKDETLTMRFNCTMKLAPQETSSTIFESGSRVFKEHETTVTYDVIAKTNILGKQIGEIEETSISTDYQKGVLSIIIPRKEPSI